MDSNSTVNITKPLLLVDLDTTLLNTADFWEDFASAVRAAADHSLQHLPLTPRAFAVGAGRMRHTNYTEILNQFNITHKKLKNTLARTRPRSTYLYPDAHTWLANSQQFENVWDLRILTCGMKQYQKLKLETDPLLSNLPCEYVLTTKSEHIKHNYPNQTGVLVDDKPGQNLPPGWAEIRIDRYEQRPSETEDMVIATLTTLTTDVLNSLNRPCSNKIKDFRI